LNDKYLAQAVADITPYSIVLMEDVDTVKLDNREEQQEGKSIPEKEDCTKMGVTLGGLLNVLDGLQSPLGALFFLTTNHINKLDAALLRPGRIDVRLEISHPSKEQKEELYTRFFPNEEIDQHLLTNHGANSMADFQELLLQKRNIQQALI